MGSHHLVHGAGRASALHLADNEPRFGRHAEFIKPLWKQGVGSTVHCPAGDGTASVLFIFQSLFMKRMMGGTYGRALKNSFIPEC